MERYTRQELITGWNQNRLQDTSLLVIGSGWLARFTSLLATAMGFGHITLLGDGRIQPKDQKFFLSKSQEGTSIVRSWAKTLEAINPEIEITFNHDVPGSRSLARVPKSDLIIAATNDPAHLAHALHLANTHNAGFVASASGPKVGIYRSDKKLSRDFLAFRNIQEDPLVSLTLAALITEEARRYIMPLDKWDHPSKGPILVSPDALHQRANGSTVSSWPKREVNLSLVGAGALGTWAGIGIGLIAKSPVHLDIYDPDLAETHNLNRQILYTDAVRKTKADALAKCLTEMFSTIRATGHIERITDQNIETLNETNAIICGPDNLATRALLNRAAQTHNIPLINGGTSAFGADIASYYP